MDKKKKKHWIVCGAGLLLLAVLAFGIYIKASGRCIKVYGTVLHVEKVYFDYDEENTCSLRNLYYKQIVSALKELSKQETVEPTHYSYDPEFTIHSYDDVRCEVFRGNTNYPVPQVIGYVDTMNYAALGVRVFKDGAFTYYYYKLEVDEASRVWELIRKAKEWEA